MWFNRLRALGILGINQRNADYTLVVNQRKFYPLVDDKLLTKRLAILEGIKVPQLYGVITYHHQIPDVLTIADGQQQFVVKPSKGCAGEGILVIIDRQDGNFTKVNGQVISAGDLMHYISGILSGLYSLGGQEDKALIEYKVATSPVFEKISFQGVPDIRIIVYKGIPVMSMVRLPTKESQGKANLHQGAVGVGIDLRWGTTLQGVHHDRIIGVHPDTGQTCAGIQIPFWDEIISIATRAYDMTKLGYIGVDIVIDREKGPMVLEFNARPGLSIQIANRAGLISRLKAIDREDRKLLSLAERIQLGQEIAHKLPQKK
jgi:alpha-L-glutamate ligase-like protein